MIALELACRRPDLVRSLVLLEPPFRAKRHLRPRWCAIGGATMLGTRGQSQDGAECFLRAGDAVRLDPESKIVGV